MPITTDGLTASGETRPRLVPNESPPDFTLACVVAGSRINRVVVSRIAERMGLKVIAEAPTAILGVLGSSRPGVMILDGGFDGRECDILADLLSSHRMACGGRRPLVILLATDPAKAASSSVGRLADRCVAKPVTPDSLQPLIARALEKMRA